MKNRALSFLLLIAIFCFIQTAWSQSPTWPQYPNYGPGTNLTDFIVTPDVFQELLFDRPDLCHGESLSESKKNIIVFGNGINTSYDQAYDETLPLLKDALDTQAAALPNTDSIKFCLAYNATYGFLNDLMESSIQAHIGEGLAYKYAKFMAFYNYYMGNDLSKDSLIDNHITDLRSHVNMYADWLDAGKNIIVVSHSQGNFFVNEAYAILKSYQKNVSSFHIVSVASPDDHVAGTADNYHITLRDDMISHDIIGDILGNMPPNIINIEPVLCNGSAGSLADPARLIFDREGFLNDLERIYQCHGFDNSYLGKYKLEEDESVLYELDEDGSALVGAGSIVSFTPPPLLFPPPMGCPEYTHILDERGNCFALNNNTRLAILNSILRYIVHDSPIDEEPLPTVPLSAPTGLQVSAIGYRQIDLSWTPSSESAVVGYRIYRNDELLYAIASSAYSDTNDMGPRIEYCYQISAFDAAGNESPRTDKKCTTTGYDVTWARLFPENSPPPTDLRRIVFDSGRGEMVLFGGGNSVVSNDETWVWNGTDWEQKNPLHRPIGRFHHALAYDAARGEVVLFGGGYGNYNYLNDTWVWDGNDWTQKTPLHSPPVSSGHAMVYDTARSEIVLFGGGADTWVWNGSDWIQKNPLHSPPARSVHAMAYDTARGEVVMFGGGFDDTWVWNGSDWIQKNPLHSPERRSGHTMTYDEVRQKVILYGGNGRRDSWMWDGNDWTQIQAESIPSAGSGSSSRPTMAYDSWRDEVILYLGYADYPFYLYNETWILKDLKDDGSNP